MKNLDKLTREQLRAVEILANPENTMTYEEICKELDIANSTLWRWRQNPIFIEAVNSLAYEMLKSELPAVYASLLKQAKKGNPKCLELTLKYAGGYIEKASTEIQGNLNFSVGFDEEDEPLD